MSKSTDEIDRMEGSSVARVEMVKTAMGPKGDRHPPSQVEREILDGKGHISLEESQEDDMQFVIRRLFFEDGVSRRINNLPPQSSSSVSPNLLLVLYNNPDKFLSM